MSGSAAAGGDQQLPSGTVLGGRYEIVRPIGRGSMGSVYEARQRGIGRRVAIKTVAPGSAQNVRRLAREAEAVGALNHPNIVQVSDVHIDAQGISFLVMELLEGESLDALAEREKLSPGRIVTFARQVGDALACAHATNIVHRDLKPGNLFVTRTTALGEVIKVLDFGVAKLEDRRTQLTAAGNIVGTPLYMAPEQIRGDTVGPATDVWSLGVLIYQLLGGAPPFIADTWQELLGVILAEQPTPLEQRKAGLPSPLYAAVGGMLTKDAKARPSLAELDKLFAESQRLLGVKHKVAEPKVDTPVMGGVAPKATQRIGSINEELRELAQHPAAAAASPRSPLDLRNQLDTGEKFALQSGLRHEPTVEDSQPPRESELPALPSRSPTFYVLVGFVVTAVALVALGLTLLS